MEKLKSQLNQLGKTIQSGQNASLITAPSIAKKAAAQSYLILDSLLKQVEILNQRVIELENQLGENSHGS